MNSEANDAKQNYVRSANDAKQMTAKQNNAQSANDHQNLS